MMLISLLRALVYFLSFAATISGLNIDALLASMNADKAKSLLKELNIAQANSSNYHKDLLELINAKPEKTVFKLNLNKSSLESMNNVVDGYLSTTKMPPIVAKTKPSGGTDELRELTNDIDKNLREAYEQLKSFSKLSNPYIEITNVSTECSQYLAIFVNELVLNRKNWTFYG